MTLKTGEMMLKVLLCFTGINCTLKYIIEVLFGFYGDSFGAHQSLSVFL